METLVCVGVMFSQHFQGRCNYLSTRWRNYIKRKLHEKFCWKCVIFFLVNHNFNPFRLKIPSHHNKLIIISHYSHETFFFVCWKPQIIYYLFFLLLLFLFFCIPQNFMKAFHQVYDSICFLTREAGKSIHKYGWWSNENIIFLEKIFIMHM